MKKKALALFIALIMLAAMGYAYSASALLDADDDVPWDDWDNQIVHNTTNFDYSDYTTTETTTTTVWAGTDADGNPTPPPTTAPPQFTNRPQRTQPNHIPWRPHDTFFHYEGGDVISRDWVCYECAGLDICVHWLYLNNMIDSIDEDINDNEEGFIEPGMERVFSGYEYVGLIGTPFRYNWLLIVAAAVVLLLAVAVVVFLLLRGKRETAAAQAVNLWHDDNYVQSEPVQDYSAAQPEQNTTEQELPDEEMSFDDADTPSETPDLPDEDMSFDETPSEDE
ncbi:MAG: hypothetical protein FWE40_06940 [Oscillospiraceae bacterium]|nr:hypothetical protein [Oscillospiraceae bacterium]